MLACPACGKELPGEFPFCPFCAARLTSQPGSSAREERKVVTSLFCDLVGFTATSERADPEDVDRMLAAYFAMVRGLLESHGGVVEKFIGDAVVGVFGVPAAHEDDPERAVRAGLRIVEAAEALEGVGGVPLRLRVGINTGEALVRLGVSAASGEGFVAGDAINTASRIQSVAPLMGVGAGLATYEATSAVFDYEEIEPAVLKGKAEPVREFHATASRARLGTDVTRTHDSPFIGREIDLALLKGIFDKAAAGDSVQLVTVAGEPGLGKSRLVAELLTYVDARPELVTWRQGRCLPYGEGITFWALGEILAPVWAAARCARAMTSRSAMSTSRSTEQLRSWRAIVRWRFGGPRTIARGGSATTLRSPGSSRTRCPSGSDVSGGSLVACFDLVG